MPEICTIPTCAAELDLRVSPLHPTAISVRRLLHTSAGYLCKGSDCCASGSVLAASVGSHALSSTCSTAASASAIQALVSWRTSPTSLCLHRRTGQPLLPSGRSSTIAERTQWAQPCRSLSSRYRRHCTPCAFTEPVASTLLISRRCLASNSAVSEDHTCLCCCLHLQALMSTAARCPLFILPVHRGPDNGFFNLLCQLQGEHFLFTFLDDYRANPATAQPYMTISAYSGVT